MGCMVLVANKHKFKMGDEIVLKIEEEQILKKFNFNISTIMLLLDILTIITKLLWG